MLQEIIKEGPSVAEALDAALEEMGVQQDAVEYEVLEEGGKRLFGSSRAAVVRVWLKPGVDTVPSELTVETGADAGISEDTEFTDEEIDKVADEAVLVINEIARYFRITPSVEEYEGDEGEVILDIIGDDLGILIGRHGRTLDALQVLVSAITNRRVERRYPVLVDVSGYRYRRRLKLEEIAKRAADRAARQRQPVPLRPMTSFERKVVHMALRNDGRVTTASEGEEPFRQVVVHPR
ncbi:MAG: KH domain-containing protein [Actinomycetia bacterium]|nr:KH domain-containing protein [Actinomycetes bacterium]